MEKAIKGATYILHRHGHRKAVRTMTLRIVVGDGEAACHTPALNQGRTSLCFVSRRTHHHADQRYRPVTHGR